MRQRRCMENGVAMAAVNQSSNTEDEGLRLNQDLVEQINELVYGEHAASECWSPAKPVLVEGLLWSALGATLWLVVLYLAS